MFDPERDPPSLLLPGDRAALRDRIGSGMSIEVLRPGAQTTVQDRGRTGLRHLGIGVAGALDAYSAAVANLLVGNDESCAVLEITLSGPTLRFA
jgi:hypothetical protein